MEDSFICYGIRRSGLHCIIYDILEHHNSNNNNKFVLENDINILDFIK